MKLTKNDLSLIHYLCRFSSGGLDKPEQLATDNLRKRLEKVLEPPLTKKKETKP